MLFCERLMKRTLSNHNSAWFFGHLKQNNCLKCCSKVWRQDKTSLEKKDLLSLLWDRSMWVSLLQSLSAFFISKVLWILVFVFCEINLQTKWQKSKNFPKDGMLMITHKNSQSGSLVMLFSARLIFWRFTFRYFIKYRIIYEMCYFENWF